MATAAVPAILRVAGIRRSRVGTRRRGRRASGSTSAADPLEPVEQVRSRERRMAGAAARQRAQRCAPSRRVARAVVGSSIAHQPELRRALGADVLLQPRLGARHDAAPACRTTGSRRRCCSRPWRPRRRRPLDQLSMRLSKVIASTRRSSRDPVHEVRPLLGRHERPEHQQRRMRRAGIVLVGADHPVDQLRAVAAAAGGDQDVGLSRHSVVAALAVARQLRGAGSR